MRSKLAIAAGCLAAFSFLYRDVHPLGSLQLSIDADSAGSKAASIVQEMFPEINPPVFKRAGATEVCPGDLFVFYTDGFTEAMNRHCEEYGEERLRHSVQKQAAGTAADAMSGIFADIKEHAGKTKQHDDMTIVVVKVCG